MSTVYSATGTAEISTAMGTAAMITTTAQDVAPSRSPSVTVSTPEGSGQLKEAGRKSSGVKKALKGALKGLFSSSGNKSSGKMKQ
jgi:hypothetical protein